MYIIMGRAKKEGGANIKSFTLTDQEVELMQFDRSREGFKSNSDYIGWLIRSRNQSVNPIKYLNELEREEQKVLERLSEIKKKKKTTMKNMELVKEIEIEKVKKRPQAIKIIKHKFLSEGIFVAQQVAKTWGILLNVEPSELMAEAIVQTKTNGVD